MENNTMIWFEARLGGSSRSFLTEGEARKYIADAGKGFPENPHMPVDDINYWKKWAPDMIVVKVTETREVLK